jgi:hypothetical protein
VVYYQLFGSSVKRTKLIKITPFILFIDSTDLSGKPVTKWCFNRCNGIMRKKRISLPATLVLAVTILIGFYSQFGPVQLSGTSSSWKVSQNETKPASIIAAGKPIWHVIPRLLLTGR